MTYATPPDTLYFGCTPDYYSTLKVKGITAHSGTPVRLVYSPTDPRLKQCKLIMVDAAAMHHAGFQFWEDNGDWCCRYAPRRFLTLL